MKDVISDICEMHTKGFKVITIAALLQQPVEVVEEVVENYQQEYDEVFYGSKVSCL